MRSGGLLSRDSRHTHAMHAQTESAPRQLDIFGDSRDVMLRNDLVDALTQRQASAVLEALALLTAEFPSDMLLAPAQVLFDALIDREAGAEPWVSGAPQLAAARGHLRSRVEPAAVAALGIAAGRAWLVPLWRDLAQRSSAIEWNGTRPDDHAAPLWLAAGDWALAAQAAGSIASWRRIPTPLAWMAEARCRVAGVDAAWPLLAALAWLAPVRLDALLTALDDAILTRLRRRFEQDFDAAVDSSFDPRPGHAGVAWFPAWVLATTPALAPHLAMTEPGQGTAPERGMRLMVELLGLERQGRHHDLVAHRKQLRDLCAPLYAAYMATR